MNQSLQSRLREILDNLIVKEFEEVVLVDDKEIAEATEAILALFEELIGEEEVKYFTFNKKRVPGDPDAHARNQLRSELQDKIRPKTLTELTRVEHPMTRLINEEEH